MEFVTLGPEHVGKPILRVFGRTFMVSNFMGQIMERDIGKRVYLRETEDGSHGILQVENDAQRDRRLKNSGT